MDQTPAQKQEKVKLPITNVNVLQTERQRQARENPQKIPGNVYGVFQPITTKF